MPASVVGQALEAGGCAVTDTRFALRHSHSNAGTPPRVLWPAVAGCSGSRDLTDLRRRQVRTRASEGGWPVPEAAGPGLPCDSGLRVRDKTLEGAGHAWRMRRVGPSGVG